MVTSFCTDANKLYTMYVLGENTTMLLSFGTLAETKREAKEYFAQMTKKAVIVNLTRMDGKLFTIRVDRTAGADANVTFGELKSVS
jgi:hypothetical protein